ncbi:hypothetical protein L596_009590 [Steinernema carpocapsae]|uniref:Uncharacterized protein n=1 Tax=Steinernema carpocapsae TaxID=34508 RepID=A0A4U5PGA9_STECR|nr:hypothetical protein L596_009590 [Steinernema carpocapsae]
MLSGSQHRNCHERHFGRLLATNSSGHSDNISVLSTIEEEDHESSPEPATTSRTDKKEFFQSILSFSRLLQFNHFASFPRFHQLPDKIVADSSELNNS